MYDFKRRYFKRTHVDYSLAFSASVDRQTKNEMVGIVDSEYGMKYEIVCVCVTFFCNQIEKNNNKNHKKLDT